MSSEHDDSYFAGELTFGDQEVVKPQQRCKNFFKKFFFAIIALGLVALLVLQLIVISATTRVSAADGNSIDTTDPNATQESTDATGTSD